jgi:hypothetical protein
MKQFINRDFLKKIEARWNVKIRPTVDDGTKYHSQNEDERVYNPIIGYTTPRELKALELQGVVAWRKEHWVVPRNMVFINGKKAFPVSYKFLNWVRKTKGIAPTDGGSSDLVALEAADMLQGKITRSPIKDY